jgi:hypothetical protein
MNNIKKIRATIPSKISIGVYWIPLPNGKVRFDIQEMQNELAYKIEKLISEYGGD